MTNVPQPRINTFNFAINGRCYNPEKQTTFYNPAMLDNPTYAWSGDSVNGDTAMGLPSFH